MSLCNSDLQVNKYLKYFESLIVAKENNKEFNDFLADPFITSKKKNKSNRKNISKTFF